MAKVILINRKRQTFIATMYHDEMCRRANRCFCSVGYGTSTSGKRVSIKYPGSFQVNALSASEPLDAAVLHLRQVKEAMKGSDPWIVVEHVTPRVKPVIKRAKAKSDSTATSVK